MRLSILIKQALVIGCLFGLSSAFAQDTNSITEADTVLEEVVVTGSFIRRKNQADQTSPIEVIGRVEMADVAAFNPVDLVATLPSNTGSQNQSDQANQGIAIGTANVNLRGLGVSSTLVLLNGRRQTLTASTTGNGDQFVDLNSLVPNIAIQQVEVLKDGASSLYGSDAVAGVVNFKTRNNFVGVELDANFVTTTSDSQEDLQFGALFGWDASDRFHLLGAVSFFDRSPLQAGQRRDEFELRNAFSTFGNPGTYLVFGATPGPPTRTVDPACQTVAAVDDDVNFIGAGPIAPTCQFDFGDFFPLVAEEERLLVFLRSDLTLNDSTELFAELGYADNAVVSSGAPSQALLRLQDVPSTNPAAAILGIPPGGRARAFYRPDGAGQEAGSISLNHETLRLSGGLVGEFGNGWGWETAVTYGQNNYLYSNPGDTKIDRFSAALGGFGGPNNDQFYNPLFGAANDPDVREDFRGVNTRDAESSLLTVDGHVTGEFGDLPAGTIGIAAGFQYRKDELSYDYSDDVNQDNLIFTRSAQDFSADQDVYALFVETDIPLTDNLNLQIALRYEDFGDENTTDPKIGLLWRPTDRLSLRGTFGTSFRSPSLFQQFGAFATPARVFDPMSGGLVSIARETKSDPDNIVGSQTSEALNFGVTWDSDESGFTASLDYWSFEYEDFITPENPTAIVAANAATGAFADQVIRDPGSGTLLSVISFFRNAGSLDTDGLDLMLSKDWDTASAGTFTARVNIARRLSYDLADPVSGLIDGLGQRNFTNFGSSLPDLGGNIGLVWASAERHSANIFVRYTTDYRDENNGDARIDDLTTVDVQYRYQASGWGNFESGPSISIGARNLGDEMPPDVVSRTGYDPQTHSPVGRQVYLSVKQTF